MNSVLEQLAGGDLRSEGRAEEVALEIITDPRLLPDLAEGLCRDDKLIRARTCMAMEAISRHDPDLLSGVVSQLTDLAATDSVPQVRWHLAQILARVPLSSEQAEGLIPILLGYLDDRSKIVKYCAVRALGSLGGSSPARLEIAEAISGLGSENRSLAKAVAKAQKDLGVE